MNRRQALSLLGAWSFGCQQSEPGRAGRRVNVSVHPYPTAAPFYAAYEFGHFDDAGFEVEIHQFKNTNMITPSLAGGAIDVSLMALNAGVATAAMRGADVRIVAGRYFASKTCGAVGVIYGHRSVFPHGLDDLTVLRGKRIAIARRAHLTEFYLDCLLETVGLTQGEIEPVYLGYAESVAALVRGDVDAIVQSHFDKDPAAASDQIVKGPGLADVHPNLQYNYMFFGKAFLEEDTGAGARFLAAYLRGAGDFLAGKSPEFLFDAVHELRLDPDLAINACRDSLAPDGSIEVEGIRVYLDWCRRKGYIEVEVDIERLTDRRFVEAAREMTG